MRITVQQMRENYNHITGVIEDKKLNDGTDSEYQVVVDVFKSQ